MDEHHGVEVGTWVVETSLDLDAAVENLARRERCDPRWIGAVSRSGARGDVDGDRKYPGEARVRTYLASSGYDAALWTGLPSTFEDRTGEPFSVEGGLVYLGSLAGDLRHRAFTYIRRAPETTTTPLRSAFDERWPTDRHVDVPLTAPYF